MKKFNSLDAVAAILWLLPVAYLLYVFPTMPDSVPVHFGLNGTVDRYGSKLEFLAGPLTLAIMSVLIYFLMKYLPSIDPKKTVKYGDTTFQKIGLGVVLLMGVLSVAIILAATKPNFRIEKMILPVVGLFFAFMGNLMHSMRPNYFAGLRTPWTLEDPDTWRATHQMAGKLWVGGGLVLTVVVLLLPATAGLITFMSILMIMILIPVIYSYTYYKKHHANKTGE